MSEVTTNRPGRWRPIGCAALLLSGCTITPDARDGASGDELPCEMVGAVNFVLRSRQIPGAVVGLVAGDGRLRAQAFGWRDTAARVPMTRETLFPIGSITRSITVSAIAVLVNRGVLSWDATLGDAFASEGGMPEEVKPITLRQLATHSSGLPPEPVGWEVDPAGSEPIPYRTSDLLDALRSVELVAAPSTGFLYSNFGIALLGVVLERSSGQVYADAIETLVLAPLSMRDSGVGAIADQRHRFALGHSWSDGKLVEQLPVALGDFAAVGGVYSTVDDLARFVAAQFDSGGPWSAVTLADMHRPIVPVLRSGARHASTGWFVESVPQFGRLLANVGQVGGASAVIAADLDSGDHLVVFANADQSAAEQIARAIFRQIEDRDGGWHYRNEPQMDAAPTPRPSPLPAP